MVTLTDAEKADIAEQCYPTSDANALNRRMRETVERIVNAHATAAWDEGHDAGARDGEASAAGHTRGYHRNPYRQPVSEGAEV